MNVCVLSGRLGRDPELKHVGPERTPLCRFSIAVSKRVKGEDRTQWVSINSWGKTAEVCSQYLRKGNRVLIEGELEVGEYEKDGDKRVSVAIRASHVEFLSERQKADGETTKVSTPKSPVGNAGDDFPESELPF
jgi:single-strand DNA-binding protein